MSRTFSSRTPFASPAPRSGRVPVAVLASRWHINYEHYAAVLEVRAQRVNCDLDGTTAGVREDALPSPAPAESAPAAPGLKQFFCRALDSLRRRRGAELTPQMEIQRAS